MYVLDTQILIDVLTGASSEPMNGRLISSVTANEFLGALTDHPTRAKYYVPLMQKGISGIPHEVTAARLNSKHKRAFNKWRTDTIVMEFGNDFPTLVEYGSIAIADAINSRAVHVFSDAIAFLPKDNQKTLRSKFRWLIDHGVLCIPLAKDTVFLAHEILCLFVEQHALKGKFRNSWNDFLIAATAMREGRPLVTRDELLMQFIAGQFALSHSVIGDVLRMDFASRSSDPTPASRESKGYINRGWDVKIRRGL